MIVKFISNIDATLYIDQEQVAQLAAGKICKCQLEIGSYLLEVVPLDNTISIYREDYELLEEKQILKRIDFIIKDNEVGLSMCNEVPIRYENADESPAPCDYNDRGIAIGKRYGIERFVTRDGKIWIVNDIKDISVPNEDKFVLNTKRYDWCGRLYISQQKNGYSYFPVVKNDKWGVCRVQENKILVPCIYDKVLSVYADWDLIIFEKDSYKVLVNLNDAKYSKEHELCGQYLVAPLGKELCKVKCDELFPVMRIENHQWFSLDCMKEIKTETFYPYSVVAVQNNKYGLCHFRSAKPNFIYDDLYSKFEDGKSTKIFYENYPIVARRGDFWGLVNADGLELTSFIYSNIQFVGEMIAAKRNNKYSLLDKKGVELTPLLFDNVLFDNESYIVESDGKFGVYSFCNNALLLPCEYESICQIEYKVEHMFTHDTKYAFLCIKDGKKGVFDKEGNLILECKYEDILPLERSCSGISDYCGYILKENGYYGWRHHDLGQISEFIYDSIKSYSDGLGSDYLVVQKNSMYGCYTFDGKIVFDVEYDFISSIGCLCIEDNYPYMFLCSQKGKTYLKDETNKIYNVLEFEEVTPCSRALHTNVTLYLVKKSGLFGLIDDVVYPDILIECEYESLNIMAIGNKYIYVCGNREGKKYVIVTALNIDGTDKIFEVQCDDIYPVLDSTSKQYIHSNFHKDRYAFIFVKEGKQGVVGLDGEIIVPAIYDEIVQVEKDKQGNIAFFMTKQRDKLAVFDVKRHCIVPAAYQEIEFENNYFIVSKDGAVGIYSVDGSSVLPCVFNKYIKLTSSQSKAYSELKKNPNSDSWQDEIPITIWGAEYNTYVAFNSETGAVIVSNPMPFDEIMIVLKSYKENLLRNQW